MPVLVRRVLKREALQDAHDAPRVMGLAVIRREGITPDPFRASMPSMFAHETMHSRQRPPDHEPKDPLRFAALAHRVLDLLSRIVTGRPHSVEREA